MTAPLPAARVAVVIVNYRSYPELAECLASFDDERSPITVVDHQSDTREADLIGSRFPHVRLLRVPDNEGFAAGVNRGARETRGTYLLLLNPDSIVEPDLAASLADWMDDNPDAAIVAPRIRNTDGSTQASARRFPDITTAIAGRSSWLTRVFPDNPLSRLNLSPASAGSPREADWVSGACMMIRREAFERVGGMDEGFFLYWEDADLCRRLHEAGWRIVYHPGFSVLHAGARSSRHAMDQSLVAFHDSAFRLFWKHASAPARLLAPVVFIALRARLAFMRRVVRAQAARAARQAS